MARTKSEIIKEINETQTLCNRLVMQIGQGYADINRTKDESLNAMVNGKIETFKKAEAQLRTLEQELANSTE
jgi:hypothetical protein